MPDLACLVQTSLRPAEHLNSNSSAIMEMPPRTSPNTIHRVKRFRERGWKSRQSSQANAASVPHGRAGAPEKRCKLIQLLLRAAKHSKDTSVWGEEGTRGKAAGSWGHAGRPNCGGGGGSGSPPSRLRDQLIVHDLKKKKNQRWGRGRADTSGNYRRARTDTQGMVGLATPYKTQLKKPNPTHSPLGATDLQIKRGVSTLQEGPGAVSSTPAYFCTALPVLPGSNEKLVNS